MNHNAIRRLAVAGTGLGLALTGASAANADDFDRFANCPVDNPAVITCIYSETTGGEFVLGNKTVPIDQTIVVQGGVTSTNGPLLGPTNGTPTMSEPELDVPGGILGIPGLEGPLLGVKSVAKLRGTPVMSIGAYAGQHSVAMQLPIRVQLKNPMLNGDCTIGRTSAPMVLNLTTGTTAPPAPNSPISGSRGTPSLEGGGKILKYSMNRLVDNSFAAPQAKFCDIFGTNGLITLAVNASVGLESVAGKNTADLQGTLRTASAANVRAALGL